MLKWHTNSIFFIFFILCTSVITPVIKPAVSRSFSSVEQQVQYNELLNQATKTIDSIETYNLSLFEIEKILRIDVLKELSTNGSSVTIGLIGDGISNASIFYPNIVASIRFMSNISLVTTYSDIAASLLLTIAPTVSIIDVQGFFPDGGTTHSLLSQSFTSLLDYEPNIILVLGVVSFDNISTYDPIIRQAISKNILIIAPVGDVDVSYFIMMEP